MALLSDSVMVSVDGGAAQTLRGHDLPPLEARTFRSRPGGEIRVTLVQDPDKAGGTASLFSFSVPGCSAADSACGGHGSCVGESCLCAGGYAGSRCEYEPCHGIQCGGHGTCAGAGSCVCESGAYTGDRCQDDDSCYGVSCGQHGKCDGGTCICSNGYTGASCELEPAPTAQCPVTPGAGAVGEGYFG